MSERGMQISGDQLRRRHNANYAFRRILAEVKNHSMPSDVNGLRDLRDDRRDFEQVLADYTQLLKDIGREYLPTNVREAYIAFAFERNATGEQIANLAADLASVSEFDKPLEI